VSGPFLFLSVSRILHTELYHPSIEIPWLLLSEYLMNDEPGDFFARESDVKIFVDVAHVYFSKILP
jgi:hypothetical protein